MEESDIVKTPGWFIELPPYHEPLALYGALMERGKHIIGCEYHLDFCSDCEFCRGWLDIIDEIFLSDNRGVMGIRSC